MIIKDEAEHPAPPEQQLREVALGTTFRKVVDDLFTHEDVSRRLEGQEDNERIKVLTEEWKLTITDHLEVTALRGLNEYVEHLDYVLGQETTADPLAAKQRDELDKRVE